MYQFSQKFLTATATALLLSIAVAGCSRDPNVRKQRYFESGQRYMARQKYREAAIQFANAVRLDSKFGDAHYQLALADLRLGSAQNAYYELLRAMDIQPNNMAIRLELAKLLSVSHHFTEARDQADTILQADPDNVEAHEIKAEANANLQEPELAVAEINRAIQIDPNRSQSYYDLGILQASQKANAPQAEASFQKAISIDPKAVGPRLALGGYYDDRQRYSESETQLREAVNLEPKNLDARSALVNHFLKQNDKDQAEKVAKDTRNVLANDPKGARFLSDYYQRAGNPTAAVSALAAGAKQFPKDRDTQRAYLDLLIARNLNEEGLRQVNAMLKSNAKDTNALFSKSVLLVQQNKASDAKSILEQVLKVEPDNEQAHYELGIVYKDLGDLGQAESEWGQSARLKPDYLPAETMLAQRAVEKGDFDGLAQIATTVIQKLPDSSEGYLMQATAQLADMHLPAAEEELNHAIKLDPNNPDAYAKLGALLIALHRDKEAEASLNHSLELNPSSVETVRSLAQIDLNRKDDAKAISRIQAQIAKVPGNADLHSLLADLYMFKRDPAKAEPEFRKAIDLRPGTLSAYLSLAAVQVTQNEKDAATQTYLEAIRNIPKDPSPYWMLGSVYDTQGKLKDAENYYRKSLDLKPDLGVAANNLAYLLLRKGDNLDEVISFAQVARREMPDSAEAADTLGWAYAQKGNEGLAIEMLQDALKKTPNSGLFHYHLGVAFQKSGDKTRARAELQKAVQLDAGTAELEQIKKTLADLDSHS